MPDDHYCTQADRIVRLEEKFDDIDAKIDGIHRHFEVSGTIGKMAAQVSRLTALVENGAKKNENGTAQKIALWVIAILAATVAGLVGANLPL
jgi:hypothetical protein